MVTDSKTTSQLSPPLQQRALFVTNAASEVIFLLMVTASPWAYGSVGVDAQFLLLLAVSSLVVLWLLRQWLSSEFAWKNCPVAICVAATILLGLFQITPLPRPMLSAVAPGTAKLLEELLPAEAEKLATDDMNTNIAWETAGQMISLYPGETRNALVPWLALLLLFLVVRNHPLNRGATERLCIALAINGTALALFGLLQFFSTPERGKIFWSYQSQGSAFGPFINRNHFAFYMNLCIGPALGLLLSCRKNSVEDPHAGILQRARQAVRELLLSPAALWIGCATALMLTSVVFCLSRGGTLAMLSGATVCLATAIYMGIRSLRLFTVLMSGGIAFALLAWFGLESIEARLGTLWTGEAFGDGRVFVMTNSWPLLSQFPIFGTGMGTFAFVEPLALHTPQDVGTLYEHAHNDYLEDLIEGGVVRLGLRLAIISLVFMFAIKAYRRHIGTSSGALALGLLFSFTSVVVHSFFEFGLYVSAIAVLTAVLCGHICNLADSDPIENGTMVRRAWVWRPAALGVATICAALSCWFFWSEGRRAVATRDLESELTSQETSDFQFTAEEDLQNAIPLFYQLANLNPYSAEYRFAVAETHFFLYSRLVGQSDNPVAVAGARRQLEAALRHTVHSRNLCPIRPEPYTRLAAHHDAFVRADTGAAYIQRAKLLAPADANLWYLCGLQELASGEVEQAWASWRQSLKLSELGLTRILDRSATTLTPEQILEKVMPDRPSVLLASAMYLFPDPESINDRRPYLEKAIAYFPADRKSINPADLHLKATILRLLGRSDEALTDYRAAIAADPQLLTARFELATLLLDVDKKSEARRELIQILGFNPAHSEAKALLEELEQDETNR